MNPRLLSLIHGELLQFLLVAIRQLGEIEVAEAAAAAERIHFFLVVFVFFIYLIGRVSRRKRCVRERGGLCAISGLE